MLALAPGLGRGLGLGRLRGARLHHSELEVGGQGGGVAALGDPGLDLDLVDIADDERVGARAGAERLGAVGVGTVVVVVLDRAPVGPLVALAGADEDLDGVLLDLHAVRPGDADGAVAGHVLRTARDVGGGDRAAHQRPARERAGVAGLRGERDLGDLGRHRRRRHGGRGQCAGHDRRAARAGCPHDVEGQDARRRREHGEDHTESQQLLAGGDETGL